MPRYRRPRLSAVPIFFTVALARRGERLLVDQVEALREAVRVTRAERPFGIEAWVVLPDHLHCIWRLPDGDCEYSVRWGAIKARFTRGLRETVGWNPTLRSASKVAKGDAGLWQRRLYDHHIRDDRDLAAHVRYCWWNPVKHGFVQRPEDWPYSSVHCDIAAGRYDPKVWDMP